VYCCIQKVNRTAGCRSLSDREIIDTFGPSEEGTVQALIPHSYEQGVEDYLTNYRDLHMLCEAPFEGIIDVFQYAKNRNVRLAMVTGKGKRSTEITLAVFGIRAYFDIIETGSPLGPRKVQGITNVLEQLLHMQPDKLFSTVEEFKLYIEQVC
jgi:phosphoglycolate phosphatase-like HAD superfamily hydrolase